MECIDIAIFMKDIVSIKLRTCKGNYMKYIVNIEETVNGEFEIEADSKEEAFNIARDKYNNDELINEPGNITCKQIAVVERNKDYINWEKF